MFDPEIREAIKRIAIENKIEPAALLAVVWVESGGKVFANVNKRLEPLIRFEGHYFYRFLSKANRNIAVTRGLAHARAGKVKNPYSQAARWKLLNKCIELDRDAALQSVSWGVGQVMGSHWRWLGYASLDAMISQARKGVGGQTDLMVRFIKKANLLRLLDERDWAGFARSYNGPGYRKNKYHLKMQNAFAYYASLEQGNVHHVFFPKKGNRNKSLILRLGDSGSQVRQLQTDLQSCGFAIVVDGDFGPATRNVVISFQKQFDLFVDGFVGPNTFEMIARHLPQPSNLLEI